MNRNALEIYRARHCVHLCIVDGEAKAVADFGVELNVVIQNRSGFVEACRKLMVTVRINVSDDGNRR